MQRKVVNGNNVKQKLPKSNTFWTYYVQLTLSATLWLAQQQCTLRILGISLRCKSKHNTSCYIKFDITFNTKTCFVVFSIYSRSKFNSIYPPASEASRGVY